MTNSPSHTLKPTEKQLRYLRDLAVSRGQTFSTPRTRKQASEEIERLRAARPSSATECRFERAAVRRDIADRWGEATRVRPEEIEGYGSNARWC